MNAPTPTPESLIRRLNSPDNRVLSHSGYLGVSLALFGPAGEAAMCLVKNGYIAVGNYYGEAVLRINDDFTLTRLDIEE
jgi:hypothetical protein